MSHCHIHVYKLYLKQQERQIRVFVFFISYICQNITLLFGFTKMSSCVHGREIRK